MRAAILVKPCAPLQIEDLELGAPAPDEVIVRLGASGICHSDLTYATMDGVPTPTVQGHEGQASSKPSARTSPDSLPATHELGRASMDASIAA